MEWTDYPRVALVVLLVFTNVGLVAAMSTSGTAYGPYNDDWDGGSTLRSEAATGADPVLARSTESYVSAGDRVVAVVLSPADRYGPSDAARVRQFVSGGGTLVIAGDRGSVNATNRLLAALDASARINGTPVGDDRHNYRNASLPVATNVSEDPLVADVDDLTLNRGTILDTPDRDRVGSERRDDVRVLVRTAPTAYLDRGGDGSLDDGDPIGSWPVAAVEPVGDGRVVVVSDASVFTNAMLERAGNRAFVRSLTAGSETVMLDYSHRPPLPPLTYAVLVLRDGAVIQAGLALVALLAVAAWARRPWKAGPLGSVVGRFRTESTPADDAARLDETELAALLAERHPDWDPERVERVSQTLIRQRAENR